MMADSLTTYPRARVAMAASSVRYVRWHSERLRHRNSFRFRVSCVLRPMVLNC
jgi:hypothetical protein